MIKSMPKLFSSANSLLSTVTFVFAFSILFGGISSVTILAASLTSPSYTCIIPLTRLNWDTRQNQQPLPCVLQKFDKGNGTLQEVSLTVTQSTQGDVGVENTSLQNQGITINPASSVTFYRPDGSALTPLEISTSQLINLAPYDGTLDYAGNSGNTQTIPLTSATTSALYSDQPTLSSFTNTVPGVIDLYTLQARARDTSGFVNQSSFSNFRALDTRATATVSYKYESLENLPIDSAVISEDPSVSADTTLTRTGGTEFTLNHTLLFILVILSMYGVKMSFFNSLENDI